MTKPWLHRSRGVGHSLPLTQRLWEKINKRGPDDCWPWLGSVDSSGYAMIYSREKKRNVRATHVVLELQGELQPAPHFCGLHTCDNPPCCNPKHLYWGTKKQNAEDKVRRGRCAKPDSKGTRNGMAKLTEDAVRAVRRSRASGERLQSIADRFDISIALVSLIHHRKAWSHLE